MTQSEAEVRSRSSDSGGGADSTRSRVTRAPVSRAREARIAPVIPITQRVRDRTATPRPRESEPVSERKRIAFRSPFTEDFPSPRCVIEDYAQGAKDFGWIFWVPGFLPLLVNLLIACPLHVLTQRPALFWAAATVAVICWLAASA